jgi:conjugative relaxase-like TrwC/TraI family protein
MLTISKPLSASQAQTYHVREFASQEQNYWSRDQQGHSEWQGRLAEQWGLQGAVGSEHFARLSEGQHPHTEEQLVRHQVSRTYEGKFGREVTSAEHRAGWDATFSAPKSVSLTALVGGDDRVREAHRESVRAALQELERYTQARIGNVHAPETTGKFIAATFEHDTARPVDGYAAPQLHTHAVIFNMTERENGLENGKQMRALQPHEMFVSQRYATAVYRSELALRLESWATNWSAASMVNQKSEATRRNIWRLPVRGVNRSKTISGNKESTEPRRHRSRPTIRAIARNCCRLQKSYSGTASWPRSTGIRRTASSHRRAKHRQYQMPEPEVRAKQAVTWARDHVFERSAVQDRRAILETALVRGMGETTYAQVRQEFERRIEAGEFREVSHVGAGRQYTTAVMVRMEREIVGRMREGNRRDYGDPMLVSPQMRIATEDRHPELNASQRQAVDEIFLSREKVVGLDGIAGAGKTTTLSVIREGAEAEGYRVEGFAPTSRAAQKLGEAGMETSTLQKHLVRGQQPDTGEKRLYVLDESSLASTRQVHEFVNRLHPNDRVLLVGDRRQHEAVEAGRPFAQLQDAGMRTVKLEEIVRQKDPELKQVVEQLARGEVREAIQNLDRQGRVHEIQGHDERIAAIATEYAQSPENTLVISPDNRSRMEINERVHAELQRTGLVSNEDHRIRTLVPRQALTGADRTWAERYEVGDVLRYSRASKETGIGKGAYAQVKTIDAPRNRLTVELQDGTERTYDPRRQQGVSVFREEMRRFSVGDRFQFTAPANELKVANRELGSIENIEGDGRLRLKMDGGRVVELDPRKHRHLDHGYAMTSHSSQGQTADRVLIHVDTELGAKDLLNSRMAYVSVSRGRYDAQIYTNNAETLGQELSRDVPHSPAIQQEPAAHKIEPQTTQTNQISQGFGLGL